MQLKSIPSAHSFKQAVRVLVRNGLITPGGNTYSVGTNIYGQLQDIWSTREKWEAYQWNPPQYTPEKEVNPNTSPKPSYDELLRAAREAVIEEYLLYVEEEYNISKVINSVAGTPVPHIEAEAPIHIGSGPNHMSSLIHHHSIAARAGVDWPIAIMRDVKSNIVEMWTDEESIALVSGATLQKNRAESAINIVRAILERYKAIAKDKKGGLADGSSAESILVARETAVHTWRSMVKNLTPHFNKALQKVDEYKNTLPKDVDRARAVLSTRISAAANRRRNTILDVVSAADAFLPPSCIEQTQALESVSTLRQSGLQKLRAATTVNAMKAIAEDIIPRFDKIPVVNAPIWLTADRDAITTDIVDVSYTWDDSYSSPRTVATFGTRPPYSLQGGRVESELGDILVFFAPEFRPVGNWNIQTVKYAGDAPERKGIYDVALRWDGSEAPKSGSIIPLISRNNCGPTVLKIRVNVVEGEEE